MAPLCHFDEFGNIYLSLLLSIQKHLYRLLLFQLSPSPPILPNIIPPEHKPPSPPSATMTPIHTLLHLTNFKSPLLQTLVPSVAASYALQTAFAIPSIVAQSEKFYDFSGSLTYLTVTALSLYLPSIRARYASAGGIGSLGSLLAAPFLKGAGGLGWRSVLLSGAVSIWAARCKF